MVDESDKSSTDDVKTKIHVFSRRRIKRLFRYERGVRECTRRRNLTRFGGCTQRSNEFAQNVRKTFSRTKPHREQPRTIRVKKKRGQEKGMVGGVVGMEWGWSKGFGGELNTAIQIISYEFSRSFRSWF